MVHGPLFCLSLLSDESALRLFMRCLCIIILCCCQKFEAQGDKMYPLTQAPREGFTEHSVDSLGSESLLGPCLTVHCSHIMVHLDKSHEFLTLCLQSIFASFFVICGFF